MNRILVALALLTALAPAQTGTGGERQERPETDLDYWLTVIRPGDEDHAWRRIPWRTAFGSAVAEAWNEKKPLLVWAMNGHPLGCT